MTKLKYSLSLFALASVPFFSSEISAKEVTEMKPAVNINEMMNRIAPQRLGFKSQRMQTINKLNNKLINNSSRRLAQEETISEIKPDLTLGPSQTFFDIDGPNGQLWYGTYELKSDVIEHQFYNEFILREYTFYIYDANFNLVGSIHDKMRYLDNEVRVPGPEEGIGMLPVITSKYFNDDDKYEIVIALAVNTTTPGINHYRSLVYSLNGEKETTTVNLNGADVNIEVDKPVCKFNSFINDVLMDDSGNEDNIYMTFMGEYGSYTDIDFEKLIDGDEEEGKKYWESVSNNGFSFKVHGKADSNGNLPVVLEKRISYQTLQGDMENSPYIMTFMHDGEAYVLCPHYKDTFFNPYYSPLEDMTMREDNSLVIDLYKLSQTGNELVSSTEIPVVKAKGSAVLASYYSVGDLRYSRDVEFNGKAIPDYIVTRCNYTTYSDETSGYCFYRYDASGNKLVTIFEDAESKLGLTSVPGKDDEVLFVVYDDDEGYIYNFVNLITGYDKKKTVKINYLLDTGFDEPEILSFNVDRVPLGNSYKYAFEMRAPLTDENDNDFIRIAWFNADGSFDRIDHVNMGTSVNYAQVFIDGTVLNPNLIFEDDAHEYLVLIKRGTSGLTSESQEELLVAQPTDEDLEGGRNLLHLTPCEKGVLREVSLYPGITDDSNRIFILYRGSEGYTADFYNLPFVFTGVDDIASDTVKGDLTMKGSTIVAYGVINVYDTYGRKVASGKDSVDVSKLPAGIYVVSAGKTTAKFIVK